MTDPTDPGPTDPGPTDTGPTRSLATRVQHPPLVVVPADNRPLNAPIQQNVKWDTTTVAESQRIARGERAGFFYSRMSNPGTRQLELLLAELQGREDCLTCASGINAIAQVLLALTRQGDHVVSFVEGYGPTRQLFRGLLTRFGVAHTLLPLADHAGLAAVLASRPTRLVFFESPTTPAGKIADVGAITALAHQYGALAVLDNTQAGFHQHGEYPVDIFVHSLTKFATGVGDVMGGAVIADHAVMAKIRPDMLLFGAPLDPLAASLMVRGLKTYFLRYRSGLCDHLQLTRRHRSRSPLRGRFALVRPHAELRVDRVAGDGAANDAATGFLARGARRLRHRRGQRAPLDRAGGPRRTARGSRAGARSGRGHFSPLT